ncbi:MAG: hypothetical protein SF097_15240 [Acidobacteriota bacterium]|nr:hypothetical protein [Acidobacteriota bacterium]
MPFSFSQAERAYKEDRISELGADAEGLRFLLLRSLSRAEHLDKLTGEIGLDMKAVARHQRLQHVFESGVSLQQLENAIRVIHAEERAVREPNEAALITELYKMHAFDWGGLHQNSLEKTIVDNYVKKIVLFDRLNESIDNELLASMRGYVQCSWYNHWTSIIIEDIFKSHLRVLPAVGKIKKVDFFVAGVPFDLKVTYLPEGYIKRKRSAQGLRPELTLLKQEARNLAVHFDTNLSEARLLELLWSRLSDNPAESPQNLIRELTEYRRSALTECVRNPDELIRWLYENQGVRRFDASNRLFLVLVNTQNYFASWKLKRAKDLLERDIGIFLGNVQDNHVGRRISFDWEGQKFEAVSDVIFVQHGS